MTSLIRFLILFPTWRPQYRVGGHRRCRRKGALRRRSRLVQFGFGEGLLVIGSLLIGSGRWALVRFIRQESLADRQMNDRLRQDFRSEVLRFGHRGASGLHPDQATTSRRWQPDQRALLPLTFLTPVTILVARPRSQIGSPCRKRSLRKSHDSNYDRRTVER